MLSTYPVQPPVHGGQRRAAEIIDMYRSASVVCEYLSVYPRGHHIHCEPTDASFRYSYAQLDGFAPHAYAEDIFSGLYAERDPFCYAWLVERVRTLRPTHVHLEQPFMWPPVARMMEEDVGSFRIIYSSQNIEAPLKRRMLEASGAARGDLDRLVQYVERLEAALTRSADLVVCSGEHERHFYEALGARDVIVCRNGASLSPTEEWRAADAGRQEERFLLTVGSAHLPNSMGFAELLLDPALFFLPPSRSLVVAGEMASLLARDARFCAYATSNLARATLVPEISDEELNGLKRRAHGFILPIRTGGGTNLKTAEAIVSGKWVVATSTAMRGFAEYLEEPGIVVKDDARAFRRAVRDVLARPSLELSSEASEKRARVSWEHALLPLRRWANDELESCGVT